jgi:sugar phosphate isomerase/epimerase
MAFDIAVELGLDAVELGTGEFSSHWHVGLDAIVEDPKAVDVMRNDLESRGLEISALACHSTPLHPNPAYAERAGAVFRKSARLRIWAGPDYGRKSMIGGTSRLPVAASSSESTGDSGGRFVTSSTTRPTTATIARQTMISTNTTTTRA